MSLHNILIIGAGQAGYQCAASLRQEGFAGEITLVGDEPGLPYQRPPLSKGYLLGTVARDSLRFRAAEFYDTQRISRVHARATAIDRVARSVRFDDGSLRGYDHLVLALGARNRVPALPGIDLAGVFGIRTLADADALAPRLVAGQRAVVVGAGFIGLEFAAAAAARGMQVQVLELASRPMARALSADMAALFDAGHRAAGIALHYGKSLTRITGHDGQVNGVETDQGLQIHADLVVYGVGVLPNSELAQAAGLAVANGVTVDASLLSSDPAISALGDLVSFPSPWAQADVRLESVQNAMDQARSVAARLAGKPAAPYAALPWFWSDQGDMRLQIAGLSHGSDQTVKLGAAEEKSLSVLCFRAGRLVAVESCNRSADHMAARKVLARAPGLTVEQARAPGFDLKAFEAATRPAA